MVTNIIKDSSAKLHQACYNTKLDETIINHFVNFFGWFCCHHATG